MACHSIRRAAMTAAGLTVLFMAGAAQAQEYEIRGCRPDLDISTCCPNLYDFPPGSIVRFDGSTCRLDRRPDDVLVTGTVRGAVVPGAPGVVTGGVRGNGNVGVIGGGVIGGGVQQPGTQNPGHQGPGPQNPGNHGGHGHGKPDKDRAEKNNNGLGNGSEPGDRGYSASNDVKGVDPSNPAHGDGGKGGGKGGDKGGDKGGKKDG